MRLFLAEHRKKGSQKEKRFDYMDMDSCCSICVSEGGGHGKRRY